MYGTQAGVWACYACLWFENDVKMYGTQAKSIFPFVCCVFENDVKMYGTQAFPTSTHAIT